MCSGEEDEAYNFHARAEMCGQGVEKSLYKWSHYKTPVREKRSCARILISLGQVVAQFFPQHSVVIGFGRHLRGPPRVPFTIPSQLHLADISQLSGQGIKKIYPPSLPTCCLGGKPPPLSGNRKKVLITSSLSFKKLSSQKQSLLILCICHLPKSQLSSVRAQNDQCNTLQSQSP